VFEQEKERTGDVLRFQQKKGSRGGKILFWLPSFPPPVEKL
jgi:hypothetical protein